AVLDGAALALAGRVPLLLPPRELDGEVELLVVDVVAAAQPGDRVRLLDLRVVGREVLAADGGRGDAGRGGGGVHRGPGEPAVLRVTRRRHRPGGAGVDVGDRVRPLVVRDRVEVDVGQQAEVDRRPAGVARGAVAVHLEGRDAAVLVPGDLDLAVGTGAVA